MSPLPLPAYIRPRPAPAAGWVGALLLTCAAAAGAQSAPKVTVQAMPRFEDLSSRPLDSGLEIRARLLDDVGNPLADTAIQVELDRGSPLQASACGQAGRVRGGSLRTDAAGGVCVWVSGPALAGSLRLRFRGDPLHLPTRAELPLEPSPGELHLAFDSPALELNLDQSEQRLTLELSGPGATLGATLPAIAVRLEEEGRQRAIAARDWTRTANSVRFSVDSADLGSAGPARLLARAAGAGPGPSATAEAVALRSATVQLEPDAVTPGRDATELRIRAQSRAGVPSSGWVDVSSDGRSVASSPLVGGIAALRVLSDSAAGPLVVRYHSDDPWWLPGPELTIEATAPAGEPARWPWLVLLAPVGYVCARSLERPGVRKPRRSVRRALPAAPPPELREPAPVPASGWAGTVRDAHDGQPIAGAHIEASLPSLREAVGVSTRSDAHGHYALPALREPIPEGAQLRVRSRLHVDLQRPLPPQGRVDLVLSSRRRALVARLVRWARSAGPPWDRAGEPTPGEVANVALRRGDEKTARWAEEVQAAAFAAEEVDAGREAAVHAAEPAWRRNTPRSERRSAD